MRGRVRAEAVAVCADSVAASQTAGEGQCIFADGVDGVFHAGPVCAGIMPAGAGERGGCEEVSTGDDLDADGDRRAGGGGYHRRVCVWGVSVAAVGDVYHSRLFRRLLLGLIGASRGRGVPCIPAAGDRYAVVYLEGSPVAQADRALAGPSVRVRADGLRAAVCRTVRVLRNPCGWFCA